MTFGFHDYFSCKPQDTALNNPLVMDPRVTVDSNTQPEDGSSMLLQKFGIPYKGKQCHPSEAHIMTK
jgi:uncharacterized protein YbaA (DUF1428 family)